MSVYHRKLKNVLVKHHPIYWVWASMRLRCHNRNNPRYPRYGGRGIKVCKQWNNFHNFVADMGERPLNHQLHRVDNNGDYCPENCIWLHKDLHTKNVLHR